MRAWFACSLNEASGRQKLCEKLSEALGKDCAKLDQNAEERLASLAVSVGGDWKTVQQVLLAKLAADSPFGLRYMLDDKAAQGAKRRIYLFGQNVHIVTCGEAALAFKQMIFDWLSREPERKFSIVITGLDCANGVATLEDIFPGFRGQLEVSTQALREWVSEAKDRNLNFQVHVTPFVPMTATFVDPTDDNGYMVLTPITFKPSPTERPHFIISKGENEDVLNYYWHDFYQRLRAQSKLLV
jgi:hypothetical protein